MAVVAMIPIASDRTATAVNPADPASVRTPKRTSRTKCSRACNIDHLSLYHGNIQASPFLLCVFRRLARRLMAMPAVADDATIECAHLTEGFSASVTATRTSESDVKTRQLIV